MASTKLITGWSGFPGQILIGSLLDRGLGCLGVDLQPHRQRVRRGAARLRLDLPEVPPLPHSTQALSPPVVPGFPGRAKERACLRAPYLKREDLEVANPDALRLPHGAVIALGAAGFVSAVKIWGAW